MPFLLLSLLLLSAMNPFNSTSRLQTPPNTQYRSITRPSLQISQSRIIFLYFVYTSDLEQYSISYVSLYNVLT